MRRSFTSLILILSFVFGFAQTPEKMSYQCVVRNSGGTLVVNKNIGLRISILQGSTSGNVIYQETYNPNPRTNANGLVTVEIGGGQAISGTFSDIDWASGMYFLKTETDPAGGTDYTVSGTSQLLSVPYALHAKTADNGFSGNYNDLSNRPMLFSGHYNDLFNLPSLFDGTWTNLSGKPSFANVATSGNYNDLSNKPPIAKETTDEFIAVAGQTTFTLRNSPAATSILKMYINGIRISNSAVSNSGLTSTYMPSNNGSYILTAGDRIQFDYSY